MLRFQEMNKTLSQEVASRRLQVKETGSSETP